MRKFEDLIKFVGWISDNRMPFNQKQDTDSFEQAWKLFIQEADKESFKFLFNGLYEKYCRIAFMFLKDRLDAEEVVLDIFLNIWKSRSAEYRPGIESYLYKSVRNRSLNKLRDRKHHDGLESAEHLFMQLEIAGLTEQDINLIINDALASESDKCRTVYEMSRKHEMKNKDIASALHLSEKSVEAYITKALKAIRNAMKKNYLLTL